VRASLIAIACCALACATAQAKSIYDNDIGWPEKLRRELRLERPATHDCNRPHTKEGLRRQNRISGSRDPIEALRTIFKIPATAIG